jgi:hypothetical protein
LGYRWARKLLFLHLTQQLQSFFEIQYQILTTFGLSAVNLESCIFAVCFLAKKSRHVAMANLKQLLIEDLLRSGDRELKKYNRSVRIAMLKGVVRFIL